MNHLESLSSPRLNRLKLVLTGTAAIGLITAAIIAAEPPAPTKPAPAKPTAAASVTMDDAAKALAAMDDEWSKVAGTKNAEQVASFYAADGTAYPPNEPACVGREAAKKAWAAYFADPNFISLSWKAKHAQVAKSGELGFTAGTYELKIKGPDGKEIVDKGKYLCTWSKQADGTWKASHDMWNSDAKQ